MNHEPFRLAEKSLSRRIAKAKEVGTSVVMPVGEAQTMLDRFERAEQRIRALEKGLEAATLEMRRLGLSASYAARKIEEAKAYVPPYLGQASRLPRKRPTRTA